MLESFDTVKRSLVEALLPACPYVEFFVQHPDVVVPESHRGLERLILQVGTDPNIMGMPDLDINERGWSATIIIRGVRSWCFVPWEAVLSIRAAGPMGEMGSGFMQTVQSPKAVVPAKVPGKRPSALRSRAFTVIKGGKSE